MIGIKTRKRTKEKKVIICTITIAIAVVIVAFLGIQVHSFSHVNTRLIIWNYEIVCEEFNQASESIKDNKDDREVLEDLGKAAFNVIWQTRDLSSSLIISSRWYSEDLYEFLYLCSTWRDLDEKSRLDLIGQIPVIADELSRVDWCNLKDNRSWLGEKEHMYQVIERIGAIINDEGDN